MPDRPLVRRVFLGLAATALAATAVVLLLGFVWPERPITQGPVDLGPAEDFPPGTVTTFHLLDDATEPFLIAPGQTHLGPGPRCTFAGVALHVVRLPSGEFRVLSARSPHLDDFLPWRPEMDFHGVVGVFRDPCHGETFAMDGTRLFGPAPRDMDRFAFSIQDGHLVVDPRSVIEGDPPRHRPASGTPTPAATPWLTEIATETLPTP